MNVTMTDPATERIRRELNEHFGPQVDLIDHSVAMFERDKAKLYRPDGSTVYGEAEHQERLAGLLARFDEGVADVTEAAEEAIAAAGRDLDGLRGSDPLDTLSGDDLARANALRPFVAEDGEHLPPARVAERARAALARKDRPQALLWLRAIERRLEGLRGRGPGDPAAAELLPARRDLEAFFDDPKAREKRERLRQRAESAKVLRGEVLRTRSRVDGSEAAALEQMREHIRSRW
jgi:hypothetical protein